jgi:GTP cyclohydrolase III
MSTTLSKFYQVRDEEKVKLKITIGYGQIGTTSVNLGKNKIISDHENTLEETTLGSGKELVSKKLFCSTIVADVRTETNETSVTYELIGGVKPFKQTLQESVESEGDVVFYIATFLFYR